MAQSNRSNSKPEIKLNVEPSTSPSSSSPQVGELSAPSPAFNPASPASPATPEVNETKARGSKNAKGSGAGLASTTVPPLVHQNSRVRHQPFSEDEELDLHRVSSCELWQLAMALAHYTHHWDWCLCCCCSCRYLSLLLTMMWCLCEGLHRRFCCF